MANQVAASAKRSVRHLFDRVAAPYVSEVKRSINHDVNIDPPAPVEQPQSGYAVPSDVFHNTLHELRTIELEQVRKGAERALSVGASGRWYFDWFERSVGPLKEHIGVEAFEPKPEDLPDYATWVASTADRFEQVADGSIDLVFAGQTSEHLWADELTGFLLEAKRVLARRGLLVVDSPNRLITEHLRWSHGGHTIELSATEMSDLLQLAGFDVERCRGLWLCRLDGQVLELEDRLDDPGVLARRTALGGDRPDDCFVWWIDAVQTGRRPQHEALRRRVGELFDAHWDTRVSRGLWPGPGVSGIQVAPGAGLAVTSLPFMLHAARWQIELQASQGELTSLTDLRVLITAPGGQVLHDVAGAISDGRWVGEFSQAELQLALSVGIHASNASDAVEIRMPLRFRAAPASGV